MPELPSNAKDLVGYEPYGVDDNGLHVHFGFKVGHGKPVVLHCNHLMLGQIILYLQAVAKEAFQRRAQRNPHAADKEVRETQSNLVRQIGFDIDVTGQSVAILCTTQDGLPIELQMPLDLIDRMHTQLPSLGRCAEAPEGPQSTSLDIDHAPFRRFNFRLGRS